MTKKSPPPGDRSDVPLVELLEFAIEQVNDGIAIMKFTGDVTVPVRIVYANETIERLSGYSREELLDPSNPFLQVQPQNRALYEAHFAEVRAGQPVRFEVELGGKDRSTWMDIRWSPLRYSTGGVTHYVAVLRDITERRQIQAEQELLYRAIEQAHDGICILEFSGGDLHRRHVTYANDAVCEMMKLSREQILTQGLAQPVFAENPELLEHCIAEVSRGATFEHDVHVRRGDDTLRWLHVTASPFYVERDRVGRLTVTYRDIEDRKRSEEQLTLLHSILSETSDFIVIANTTRPSEGGPQVTYANPAFAELVGLKGDRVVGRGLLEFLSPRNEGKRVAGVTSRLERHQSIANELLLRRIDDGNDVWIELTGHQVRGEGGRPVSWFLIGKDISVRKQSYAQTVQLTKALDLAEEPIAIYGVIKPYELKMQHMNERATAFDQLLFENVLLDPSQGKWIESVWPALESGRSVNRLVRVAENDSRRWVTLEILPLSTGKDSLTSIIAIEHGLRLAMYDGLADGVATALALGREILRYTDLDARRDAFLEVLREEWCAKGSFNFTDHVVDVVFRVKDRNGTAVMPGGVFFERSTAVDFSWSGDNPPRRLTALRIFLETLTSSD
ncbi:MAG: domain S-box [Candidatus Eremiobacteraeota bacterium]|nr:domain S-box [Candidatus Eremiobacteraeota bacterium]